MPRTIACVCICLAILGFGAALAIAQSNESARANALHTAGKRLDARPLDEKLAKPHPDEAIYRERLACWLEIKSLETSDPAEAKALRTRTRAFWALHLVAAEEIVLFARWAVRAAQAADQQNCHTHRNQNGDHISVRRKPMNRVLHIQDTHSIYKLLRRWTEYWAIGTSIGTPKIPANQSYHRQNSSVIQRI
jgi:hypothetical protein